MIKSKITRLFIAGTAGLLISCNTTNNSGLEQTINEVKDGQQVILKKIASLEKSVANLAVASKNKPAADNKKQQPPKADPNKVYNVEIGDSFTIGPKNAKVTIIEWMDFQ
jgi:protein-disulfide isomerase